jgi:integration host factor subunit alpha
VGLPKNRYVELIDSILEIIKKTLENGEDVLITGFGKFSVKNKNERRGRNPATGENLTLGSRRVVLFRCSPVLRDKLNGKR